MITQSELNVFLFGILETAEIDAFAMVKKADVNKIDLIPRLSERAAEPIRFRQLLYIKSIYFFSNLEGWNAQP